MAIWKKKKTAEKTTTINLKIDALCRFASAKWDILFVIWIEKVTIDKTFAKMNNNKQKRLYDDS